MRNTKFNSKEEYLAYRSNWRAEYKELSKAIREQKLYIRSLHTPSSSDYYELFKMREKATAMLEERKWSKEEAQRQYLAAKAQLQAALN